MNQVVILQLSSKSSMRLPIAKLPMIVGSALGYGVELMRVLVDGEAQARLVVARLLDAGFSAEQEYVAGGREVVVSA